MTGPRPSTRATARWVPWIAAWCRCTYRVALGASGVRSASRSASSRSAGNAVARDGAPPGRSRSRVFLLVAVLEQQLEELGGAGQPPERDRPDLVRGGVGVTRGEDLGDPGHGGLDPDRVPGLDAGDHGAQPVLVGPRRGHVTPAAFGLDPLLVQGRVGLDDLGLRHRQHPAGGLPADDPRHRPVHDADPVGRQVPGQLRHPPRHIDIGLAGRRRPPRSAGGGGSGPGCRRSRCRSPPPRSAGQRDLTQAQLLHRGVPSPPSWTSRSQLLGGLRGVHRGPLRQHLQVADLGPSTSPHRVRRGSQQATRVEVGQVVVHETNAAAVPTSSTNDGASRCLRCGGFETVAARPPQPTRGARTQAPPNRRRQPDSQPAFDPRPSGRRPTRAPAPAAAVSTSGGPPRRKRRPRPLPHLSARDDQHEPTPPSPHRSATCRSGRPWQPGRRRRRRRRRARSGRRDPHHPRRSPGW